MDLSVLRSLKKKIKSQRLVQIVESLEDNLRNYHSGNENLKSFLKLNLEGTYSLLRQIKRLSRKEQFFIKDEIKSLKEKMNKFQDPVSEFNPLRRDLNRIWRVFRNYQSELFSDTCSFENCWFYDANEVFHFKKQTPNLDLEQSGSEIRYNPQPILEMFYKTSLVDELGLEQCWSVLRRAMNEQTRESNKYKGLERECLTFIEDVADKVNNEKLPEPTGKGIDYFNHAVKELISNQYKTIK